PFSPRLTPTRPGVRHCDGSVTPRPRSLLWYGLAPTAGVGHRAVGVTETSGLGDDGFTGDALLFRLSFVDVALRVAERGEEAEEDRDADRDDADQAVHERNVVGGADDPAAHERASGDRRPCEHAR